MSFKPVVQTDSTGEWYGNQLRFATREEALASARDLAMRWTLVLDWDAQESPDPVNYKFVNNQLEAA
jgi:hypothetical protein